MPSKGVILITGGSRGIGAATAQLAAAEGYTIALNYRQREKEANMVVSAIERNGGSALAMRGDIAKEGDVNGIFAQLDQQYGTIDGLVNNAGINGHQSEVTSFEAGRLERLFAVNVIGMMLCCREAIKRMSTRNRGRGGAIVNVSSMAATIGGRPGACDYAASKAAVDVFTLGLAKEVGREGIRINAVRPGMTLTDLSDDLRNSQAYRETISASIPMNRIATPEEIARPIVWLLSDEASFISGACLDVSGGGFHVGAPP